MQVPFYLVDVFADAPLRGNPLAVVSGGETLQDRQLEEIARELRQAETTFILPPTRSEAQFRLRSFTLAGVEVYGAGHNSLGAWWWLAEMGHLYLTDGVQRFIQEIGDTPLPVEVEYRDGHVQSITLTQGPAAFGALWNDRPALAAALGLREEDVAEDVGLPQTVSTGVSHLLAPIRSREAIRRASPEDRELKRILKEAGAAGCYLFSLDPITPNATARARFFNPTEGLAEDSATGTAAGPLACHLIARGIAREDSAILIEQGYELERPSMLQVRVSGSSVRLSGRCVITASGTLRVS